VQKREKEDYKNPDMDHKAREVEQADRDAKKPGTPRYQRKSEERLVAPRRMGNEVGAREKEKRTGPTRAGNTRSMDYIKKRWRIKAAQRLD